MNPTFDELCRQAVKGDMKAQKQVFALAEKHLAEGSFKEAALTFREAAIAYRIAAARNRAHAQEAAAGDEWGAAVIGIHQRWIEANAGGMRTLPQNLPGIDLDAIRDIVVGELLADDYFSRIFSYLEGQLDVLGFGFSSPGASIQRVVWMLVAQWYGLVETTWGRCLAHPSVRVGIDQLADEVGRRFRQPQASSVLPPTSN